jgi:hypothetical protein
MNRSCEEPRVKVRMRVGLSGTRDGVQWPARGSVIDLPDAEAADYCAAGMAEPVAVFDGDEEKAVVPDDAEERGPLTTKRGPGRPRKVTQ